MIGRGMNYFDFDVNRIMTPAIDNEIFLKHNLPSFSVVAIFSNQDSKQRRLLKFIDVVRVGNDA